MGFVHHRKLNPHLLACVFFFPSQLFLQQVNLVRRREFSRALHVFTELIETKLLFSWTWCFSGDSVVRNLPAEQETWAQSLGWEDPLEKEMATHSSSLAWEILWTEEPGGLQSMGSQKSQTRLSDWTTTQVLIGYWHSYWDYCWILSLECKLSTT